MLHLRPTLRFAAAVVFVLPWLAQASAALASLGPVPTTLVRDAASPVELQHCEVAHTHAETMDASFNVANRTTRQLTGVRMQYRFFNGQGVQIGESMSGAAETDPIASADTATLTAQFAAKVPEPMDALARATCRVIAARFSGGKSWTRGQHWPEKLVQPEAVDAGDVQSSANGATGATASRRNGAVAIAVTNAWNDTLNGQLYVHDTVSITGGAADATLRATDFALAMNLANGARKTYAGLQQGAPTYEKFQAVGNNTQAFQVDPATDLGRLGSIIVPAHGSATVTVTFLIADPVANANDNRGVALR